MKEKNLHVVSSACYRGTLKQAFYGMGIEDEVTELSQVNIHSSSD